MLSSPPVLSCLWLAFLVSAPGSLAQMQQNVPESLRLGGLWFGPTDDVISYAWDYAISMVNDDRSTLMRSRLIPVSEKKMVPKDSFVAANKVCKMFAYSLSGLVALFGPQTAENAGHVQSMAETLHIPHVETRWDYSFQERAFSINMHPHPSIVGKALSDLIREMDWTSFIIIYEDEESLIRLQEIIKMPKTFTTLRISLWQLDPMSTDYRPMLKAIDATGERNIVLDCQFDKIGEVLRQADEIGLISVYHNYLITSLDVERVDLGPYKYVDVNITGFRMVDPSTPQAASYVRKWDYVASEQILEEGEEVEEVHHAAREGAKGKAHPLYLSNALVFDAVHVLANALDEIATMEGFNLGRPNCDQPRPWADGEKIMRQIRKTEHVGLTGEFRFDQDGYRTDFQLDLLNKNRDNMKKIGTWTPGVGVNLTLTQTEIEEQHFDKIQNQTLRITTWMNTPFVIPIKKPKDVSEENWNRKPFLEKFEGYCIDLVYELSKLKSLKFNYDFQLVGDKKYGSFVNGEWNGMIRELRDRKADMAVLDLSITAQRQAAVDFTMPYMSTGVGILYKKKAPPPNNLFSFLSPLSMTVWMYTMTGYLACSILMFLMARITPYEWENPQPWKPDPEEVENICTLANCLWFGASSFLCQGCDILPKAISTRMIGGMWWFFALILISSYTANLAAFLTAAKMEGDIKSSDDLAKQTKVKYGTYCCGSTNAFFKGSTLSTIQKLNAFMESAKPSVYTDGNKEGIERVMKEDGGYAFFMEAASMEYHMERNCELTKIGTNLDSKGYGIALPPGSPYTKAISDGILELQEKGTLTVLKNRWWKVSSEAGSCQEEVGVNSDQLGLPNLGGVFIVLLAGIIISVVIGFGEFVWENRLLAFTPGKSLLSEMWTELKFSMDFRQGDSKPVIRKEISTTESHALLSNQGGEVENLSNHTYGVIGDDASSAMLNPHNSSSTGNSGVPMGASPAVSAASAYRARGDLVRGGRALPRAPPLAITQQGSEFAV